MVVGAVILIMAALFAPCRATGADEVPGISRAELKHLVATANKLADYQTLATYFHEREDFYRAKAQAEVTEYAQCARNLMMKPKFATRADQTARLYEYYSAKASQQAKLAARSPDLYASLSINKAHIASVTAIDY